MKKSEGSVSLLQRLKRLDDVVLPRAGRYGLDRPPTRWERWVAEHAWQAALMAAVVVGLLMSAAWMLVDWIFHDYPLQLNNFVLGALLWGGLSFGVFASGRRAWPSQLMFATGSAPPRSRSETIRRRERIRSAVIDPLSACRASYVIAPLRLR